MEPVGLRERLKQAMENTKAIYNYLPFEEQLFEAVAQVLIDNFELKKTD